MSSSSARPRLAASSLLVSLALAACGPDAPPREPPAPAPAPPATGLPVTPGDLPTPTSIRLSRDVLPRAYELKLTVDPSKDRFSGEVAIEVTIGRQLRDIVLHGRDLAIKSVRVVSGSETIAATTAVRAAVGARDNQSELVVRTEKLLLPGKARLVFVYDAPFATLDGLYKTKVGEESFAFTQMEPIDARRAFPSFDDPGFKSTFAVSLTVPKGFDARSNGKIVSRTSGPDGDTVTFAPTPPIPAYLVAMTVGPMEYAGDDAFGLVAQKGMTKLGTESVDAARKILADQAAYTGIPYAYGKLDLAALPNFGPGAMENVGLVTFRDEFLLLDADPPADIRRRMRGIVSHELAHQWFGDLVTMDWWDDLWLNEAFATWMGPKTCDVVFPGMNAVADRVLFEHRAADGDMLPSSRAVRPNIKTEDAIHETGGWSAYLKGSVTLAMVESYIGEAKFRASVQDYLKSHAHGNATMRDFSAALQKAAPGSQVEAVLESFVTQPGIPLVELKLTCDAATKKGRLDYEVKPLRVTGLDYRTPTPPEWVVPVCPRVADEPGRVCQTSSQGRGTIELQSCPKWVYPDRDEVGYFRWKLDDASWKKLLDSAAQLSPTERAGLVLQPWSLAQAGEGSMQAVVDALRAVKLRKDEPRIVVEAVVEVLREMDRIVVEETSRHGFQGLVLEVLAPVAIPVPKLPRTTAGDEQRQLRITLLAALIDLVDDHPTYLKLEAAKRAATDSEIAALDLRLGARRSSSAVTQLATEKGYLAAVHGKRPFERTAVQAALGSFKGEVTLRAALDLTLLPSFQPGEFRNVRAAAMRFPDTREVFITWVTEKYEPLAKKLGGGGSLTSLIGRVCDEKELKRLEGFFAPRIASIEGGQRGYDEGRADARRCIATKSRLAPQLTPLLAKKK